MRTLRTRPRPRGRRPRRHLLPDGHQRRPRRRPGRGRHRVRGPRRYSLEGAYRVLVTGDGVTGEVVPPKADPKAPKGRRPIAKLAVRFQVTPDATPGPREVRIATPLGVSTVGQVVVVRDPIVREAANNDTMKTAQAVHSAGHPVRGVREGRGRRLLQVPGHRGTGPDVPRPLPAAPGQDPRPARARRPDPHPAERRRDRPGRQRQHVLRRPAAPLQGPDGRRLLPGDPRRPLRRQRRLAVLHRGE